MAQQLDFLLAKFSIQGKELEKPCSEKHANRVALKVTDWEALAPFIGLEHQDVEDIKDEHRKIRNRRLALLRKWRQKHGRDATYLNLVEGLLEIDRRDLVEEVLKIIRRKKPRVKFVRRHSKTFLVSTLVLAATLLALLIVNRLLSDSLNTHLLVFQEEEEPHSLAEAYKHFVPPNNLPILSDLFVGREHDVVSITTKLLFTGTSKSTHIINIYGPPAFGKSTLAIHVGYRLVSFGIAVRYIDVLEQRQLQTTFTDSGQTGLGMYKGYNDGFYSSNTYGYELLNWAQTLLNDTVLILDNCDGILSSNVRQLFIGLIQDMPGSNSKLKLIVTSQERLLLINYFQTWLVGELDSNASKQLLGKIIGNISSSDAIALGNSVDGCPLALRVIGTLVTISGSEFIPSIVEELNHNLIITLDKVSDKRVRFKVVMDVAVSNLDRDLRKFGRYLTIFPGSFNLSAVRYIMFGTPYNTSHVENLVRHSLLQEYILDGKHRFKMHKLIREYFREQIQSLSLTGAPIDEQLKFFHQKFRKYYSYVIIDYTSLNNTSEQDYSLFSAEKHNIDYLMQSFQALPWQEYCTSDLSTLAIAITENWIPLEVRVLEEFSKNLKIEDMNNIVCPLLKSHDDCTKFYLHILERIYSRRCIVTCHSNLGCIMSHVYYHTIFSYGNIFNNHDTKQCDLFSCLYVEHVQSVISHLSPNWTNDTLLVSLNVKLFHEDFLQAKNVCLHMDYSSCFWLIIIGYGVFQIFGNIIFKENFYFNLPVFVRVSNDKIVKVFMLEIFEALILRFFFLTIILLASDIYSYLFPAVLVANQTILYHLFSPSYLTSSYFTTYLLVVTYNTHIFTIMDDTCKRMCTCVIVNAVIYMIFHMIIFLILSMEIGLVINSLGFVISGLNFSFLSILFLIVIYMTYYNFNNYMITKLLFGEFNSSGYFIQVLCIIISSE